jgi:pyruvate carboxylase subunit B
MTERLKVEVNGKWFVVEVEDLTTNPVRTLVDGHVVDVSLSSIESEQSEARTSPTALSQASAPAPEPVAPPPTIAQSPTLSSTAQPQPAPTGSGSPSVTKMFTAPMPGTILSILVTVGDQVVTGDTVCILEAMKMQQSLRADWSGIVKTVYVGVGDQVLGGAPILELE